MPITPKNVSKARRFWETAIPVLLFLGLWEAAARFGWVPGGFLLPPFSGVLLELGRLLADGTLVANVTPSLFRVLAGFLLGSGLGLIFGIAMGCSRLLDRSLTPIAALLYPIPALGWLPIFMLWFGIGETLPIAVIFVCCFFPVLYTTATGIRSVDEEYVNVARTLGAGRGEIVRRVLVPLALPSIFTGLRLEAGMAWRVIIAAEMVAIPTGIGALLLRAESILRLDTIIACLFVLALLSFSFERFFAAWERRLTRGWAL